MRQLIGLCLLVAPFIALFALMVATIGIKTTVFVVGFSIMFTVLIFIGAWLMFS